MGGRRLDTAKPVWIARPGYADIDRAALSITPDVTRPWTRLLSPRRLRTVFRSSSARSADYWTDSQRPLPSLIFLLPLLGLYEFGLMRLSETHVAAVRNGADVWMRGWLLQAGLDRPWILPVLIVVTLLGWHVCERRPWKTSPETILGMGAESLLGAVLFW